MISRRDVEEIIEVKNFATPTGLSPFLLLLNDSTSDFWFQGRKVVDVDSRPALTVTISATMLTNSTQHKIALTIR